LPRDHSAPVIAPQGQWSRQSVHDPQRLVAHGSSGSKGASVNTVASVSRGPCSGLISSPLPAKDDRH
jgi:hypothetical protein